ncbi:MAG: DUF2135 domain-containing protein [Myxococcota bacterium]
MNHLNHRARCWPLGAAGIALLVAGCSNDSLAADLAHVIVTPEPVEGSQQRALNDNIDNTDTVGLDLGYVPLHGLGTASFLVENDGSGLLKIENAQVTSAVGGTFEVIGYPDEVRAHVQSDTRLQITFSPRGHEVAGQATITLQTNAGDLAKDTVEVIVRGTGLFVGNPNLEVHYSGQTFPQAGDCVDRGDGKNVCTLAPLAFGNVPLDTSASQVVRLLNVPPAGECLPPPGSPACTPVCRLRVDRDPTGRDLGLGFAPDDQGFSVVGNVPIPFTIEAPQNDEAEQAPCFANEVRLLVNFDAGSVERDADATLVLETNDPDAPFIEIPLVAAARVAPIAVADFRACDPAAPSEPCTIATDVHPLDEVFLDGRASYDPGGLGISSYHWEMIEWPVGAESTGFDSCIAGTSGCFITGQNSALFSVWLPLAGRYVARLEVTNTVGIESGVSPTSDVEIVAIPSSRVHIQLVWDNAENDMDLHLTRLEQADLVCDAVNDCFWGNCKPDCMSNSSCAGTPPIWDPGESPMNGANPRLDIDDTNGLGPENVNIDEPQVGTYRVYVHYYGLLDLIAPPTVATVRIFIDGNVRAEYRRSLNRDDLWRIADIAWDIDGNALVTAAAASGGGVGEVKQMVGCTGPFNFDLGF